MLPISSCCFQSGLFSQQQKLSVGNKMQTEAAAYQCAKLHGVYSIHHNNYLMGWGSFLCICVKGITILVTKSQNNELVANVINRHLVANFATWD